MDEPTSALSTAECETLFKVVRQLAQAGVAIIYTSHRLDEVVALADRVTVLRDGQRVLTAPIEGLSQGAIISAMVGREVTLTRRDSVASSRRARSFGAQSHARQGEQPRLAARAPRRELRCPAGRNPRDRRVARIRAHRDSRIDLRRRARLARRRDRHRRRTRVDQFGRGRLPPRRGAGDRGSQGAWLAHRFDHSGQCRAAVSRRGVAFRRARLRPRG